MINELKKSLWQQFGASVDMLENAIEMCPQAFWNDENKFWYNAFHCLFFLDYYLTTQPANFLPPQPFTFSEFEDKMPEKVYSKQELLTYLQKNRLKCHNLISNMTEESAQNRWINESKTMDHSIIEILIYNLRHLQHHAAQLNLLLRQKINDAPQRISIAEMKL